MAFINDIRIQISLATKPITQKGFSLPLLLGAQNSDHPATNGYYEITSPPELIAAGYGETDPEYIMAGMLLAQTPQPDKIAVHSRNNTKTIPEALNQLVQINNDWYALLIAERDAASIHAAGDWTASNEKILFACSSDMAALEERNNMREAILIHDQPEKYPECAWVGCCLAHTPGSISWKYQTPNLAIASKYDLAQLNKIRKANAQTLVEYGGVVYTDEGKTTSGEFIDTIQALDYVRTRLHEDLMGLYLRNQKIPFDDSGITLVESVIRTRLRGVAREGLIAGVGSRADKENSDDGVWQYQVMVPERAQIPQNDRAARILSGVQFRFVLAGAIHIAQVNGEITV